MRHIGLAVLLMLLHSATALAACTGSSPTWTTDMAALQTCINGATSGDTITVTGSGSSAVSVTTSKALKITGPGKATLTLTGGIAYTPTTTEAVKTFEVSGFTFSGSDILSFTAPDGTHPITGLKIHDNAFNDAVGRSLQMAGLEFGVFYSNTFDNNNIAVSVIGIGSAGETYPHVFGSANYPYFEDNTFGNGTGSFVYETGQGGRIAFRHNTITGYDCSGCEVFDQHGDQGTGGTTISAENYHNTVGVGTTFTLRWMHHRGGQSIIANNTVSRNIEFNITEYNAWYGPSGCAAYPAAGQINNSFYFGNVVGGSAQNPSYTNGDAPSGCGAHHESEYVLLNREYWLPSSGTESALPGTCTADGNTYYGTTDTDKIYKCTATNTWTVFFTPYQYPHPLRGLGGGSSSGGGMDL